MSMQVSLHGRLGRDPKDIQTATGTMMAVADLAVTVPHSKGEDTETLWFGLVAFGRVAESLLRHKQADMLNVMGNVQMNCWKDAKGDDHQTQQVVVEALLSARTTRPGGGRKASTKTLGKPVNPDDPNDALPF